MKGLGLQALVTVAAVVFVIVIAAALAWKYRPQPTAPPADVASNYGTVGGMVTWEYGDIASNYQCVKTYPCAGCTVRFYRGDTLVKEIATAGASLGKVLGCPRYSEGSGAFSTELLAGGYRIYVPSPDGNVGDYSANVTVRANGTVTVDINLKWAGPV